MADIVQIFRCNYCINTFSKKSSLTNHMKRCKEKQNLIDEYENKLEKMSRSHDTKVKKMKIIIDKLQVDLEWYKKMVNKDESQIDNLIDTNKHYQTVVDNAEKMIDKSMSSFNLIVNKFKTTPAIKAFDDFDSIRRCVTEEEEYDLADLMIYHFKKNNLGNFLGMFIIKEYKKEDPSQQSFWVTDVARLSCVVRKVIGKKDKWEYDKHAEYLKKIIILPITEFVISIMDEKIVKSRNTINENIKKSDIFGIFKQDNISGMQIQKIIEKSNMDQNFCTQITEMIKQNILETEILKKIKPTFFANKECLLIK